MNQILQKWADGQYSRLLKKYASPLMYAKAYFSFFKKKSIVCDHFE